jgi:LEA14-like dessication related protein
MTRTSFLPTLALVVSALFLGGCASAGKIGGVSVTVAGIQSAQPSLFETQAVVTLRYLNENVVPIGLSGSRHKLYLNGTLVGQAVSNKAVGLPQLAAATETVTVIFNNASVIGLLRGLAKQPQAAYRLDSVLYLTAGEEKLEIKSRGEGSLDLSGLQLTAP